MNKKDKNFRNVSQYKRIQKYNKIKFINFHT